MKDGDPVTSFTIVTCPANAQMSPIHDRMPALLSKNQRESWMSGREPAEICAPYSGDLDIYPVKGPIVGDERNLVTRT